MASSQTFTTVSRTVSVDRPAAAVGSHLAAFETSAAWVPHTRSCTRVDAGPVRVGARFRTVAHVGPLTETIEQEVVEYDADGRLVLEGTSTFLRTRDEIGWTANAAGGTDVTYTARVRLVGRARIASAALPVFMATAADTGTERLRRALLEAVPGRDDLARER